MICPKCNGNTRVECTRNDDDGVYRARICKKCGLRFYTSEYKTGDDNFSRINRKYYANRRRIKS